MFHITFSPIQEGVKLFSSVYNSANTKNKKKRTTQQFFHVHTGLAGVKWNDLDELDLENDSQIFR